MPFIFIFSSRVLKKKRFLRNRKKKRNNHSGRQRLFCRPDRQKNLYFHFPASVSGVWKSSVSAFFSTIPPVGSVSGLGNSHFGPGKTGVLNVFCPILWLFS